MTRQLDMPRLKAALAARSYYRLDESEPDVADALRAEVARGAKPDDVFRMVAGFTESKDMARWLYQAALYLAGTPAEEDA